jgi:sialic acid synthase
MPKREIVIGQTIVNDDNDCFVIAEIGHNHQGSIEKCIQLFKAAHECGVNAVKLQKRDNKRLYTKDLYCKSYDNENSYGSTYGLHREALEFGWDEYVELKKYAEELNLIMFATAFDESSVDFLEKLGVSAYKIASGDLFSTPLLKYIARTGKPMIVSTGGASLDDVKRAYHTIMPINSKLCFLQCTAAYPVEFEKLDLKVISTFREAFPDIVVGLSDHDNGIAMAPVAYMLGARIIEKHFTLNHAWKGTDHAFSLEPIGMRKLVRDLRRTRIALGDGVKKIYDEEKQPIIKMSKKAVARRSLPAGHIVEETDIIFKSPGDGIKPFESDTLIGKILLEDLPEDGSFSWKIIK